MSIPAGMGCAEAEELYRRLEHEIVPEFYTRDGAGIPRAGVARMRGEHGATCAVVQLATALMREYVERLYLPAAAAFQRRSAQGANWRKNSGPGRRGWRAIGATSGLGTWRCRTRAAGRPSACRCTLGGGPRSGSRWNYMRSPRAMGPLFARRWTGRPDPWRHQRYAYRATRGPPPALPLNHAACHPAHPAAGVPLESTTFCGIDSLRPGTGFRHPLPVKWGRGPPRLSPRARRPAGVRVGLLLHGGPTEASYIRRRQEYAGARGSQEFLLEAVSEITWPSLGISLRLLMPLRNSSGQVIL